MPIYWLIKAGSPDKLFQIRILKQNFFANNAHLFGEVKVSSADKLHKYPVPLPPNYV
jgi:hypothetical protein